MSKNSLPKVVIVGRPNVGKSSLFNRILGSRKAIVESSCGTTRDRLYADIVWKDKRFTLVDTGGFEAQKGPGSDIHALVLNQLHAGIEEADIIFFVTDSSVGVLPQDMELASKLRKTSKRIYVIANKSDDGARTKAALDFFELGLGDPHPVSALNSIGIEKLLDDVIKYIDSPVVVQQLPRPIAVAIIGRPNVGKSSYLNSILREERVIVHPTAGTTRDSIDINFKYKGHEYLLIDTAGMRHNSKIEESADFFSNVRSKEAIKRADVAVIIVDGYDGLREDDMRIIDFCIKEGKSLLIAINKCDLINEAGMRQYTEMLVRKMNAVKNFPVMFISCKTKKNVTISLDTIFAVYERSRTVIQPAELTVMLESLRKAQEINRWSITVTYLKQAGSTPPAFILGTKSPRPLTEHIKRHMENLIKEMHDFKGVPIRINFESRSLPFGGRMSRGHKKGRR
ncbi:MAG: ribosome biogenesis GTPase Der [Candidatus Omnitrophota bacterium]|jgi:GTP-binding protein